MAIISDGTTIADAASFSVGLGNMVLLNTATASSSSSLSFNSTYINSTYPIYKFEFINIHLANNDISFQMNFSTDNGSNYNVTKTTTYFRARHSENGSTADLAYTGGFDLAQGTGNQVLADSIQTTSSDESICGTFQLFNPSSTTYVKHFLSRFSSYTAIDGGGEIEAYCSGYGNTTSAINAIKFVAESGNIDSGQIKLYGIKGS